VAGVSLTRNVSEKLISASHQIFGVRRFLLKKASYPYRVADDLSPISFNPIFFHFFRGRLFCIKMAVRSKMELFSSIALYQTQKGTGLGEKYNE